MQSNTLEAFVVKRKNILLPALKGMESYSNNTFWRFSVDRNIVHREILIESKEETVDGYNLYGTEIPVIFSYPNTWERTNPKLKTCIGVATKQWEALASTKISNQSIEFHYDGKFITDEDVITWLENEKNIESMKRVREYAIQYGERCKELLEFLRKRKAENFVNQAVSEYGEYLENEEKVKKLRDRRNELISRYNHS